MLNILWGVSQIIEAISCDLRTIKTQRGKVFKCGLLSCESKYSPSSEVPFSACIVCSTQRVAVLLA